MNSPTSDPPLFPSRRWPEIVVFVVVFLACGVWWHSRDWNTASRLMLTYALVDRGTVRIDGLENQTGDRAWFKGHSYSDKFPGWSLLAVPWAWVVKRLGGFPDHPLNVEGLAYWPTDYWTTWGVSGGATAWTAALVAAYVRRLGGSGRAALLAGFAYGLATPAWVYGSLAYGHQVTAWCGFLGWMILTASRVERAGAVVAGLAAAWASVVELQAAPISAILGLLALRRLRGGRLALFVVGAAIPTAILAWYNVICFGSPLEAGYFHHATPQFAAVHNPVNPLGLAGLDPVVARELVVGSRRGLIWFAPIVILAPPGLLLLGLGRKRWLEAGTAAAIVLAVYFVNVAYPEWTGGWSTGPRLLTPALPFLVALAAACWAGGGRVVQAVAWLLAVVGFAQMVLFQAVGGRIPHPIERPLTQAVLPLWKGDPLPAWKTDGRFARFAWWHPDRSDRSE